MTALQFNAVLLQISNELSREQLEQMKFLCKDMIGKKERETIDTGVKIFRVLEERGKLGADNTDYLCQLLTEIRRHDLSEKIKGFESVSGSADNQPDEQERGTVCTCDVVEVEVGLLARKGANRLIDPF